MQSLTHSLPCNHIRRAVPFMHGGVHLRRRVLGDHAPPAVVEEARRVSGRLRALPGWWDHARAAMLRNAIRPCMPRGPTRPRALCEILCLTCRFPRGSLLLLVFRCLSTEQLRPQAPMLKLWRRRMSLFLACVTVVVILSLTIGISACDPCGLTRLMPRAGPTLPPTPYTSFYITVIPIAGAADVRRTSRPV
jgi:hypothetical protein